MKRALAAAASLLVVIACSSSSGNTCGAGVTFSGKSWADTCETWLESNCCNDLFACGGDTACKAQVACINACAEPRTDACVNACGGGLGLSQLASCTKSTPAGGAPIPAGCVWPK